jgi:acetyl-CoA carboxylase biotin carboxyl carrier protein
MSESKLTQQDVQEILKLFEAAEHVAEFRMKYGDVEVRVSRSGGTEAVSGQVVSGEAAPAAAPAPAARKGKPAQSVPQGMAAVKSPMVGTFYRAPSPGAPPFVEVGQKVQSDTVVCIIEVMKLMNSIPAGTRGVVTHVLVEDGDPVEFGQVLLVIEPR